jgi:hypothetical protein
LRWRRSAWTTKAPIVLRGMVLTHLSKNEKAIKELHEKDMEPN